MRSWVRLCSFLPFSWHFLAGRCDCEEVTSLWVTFCPFNHHGSLFAWRCTRALCIRFLMRKHQLQQKKRINIFHQWPVPNFHHFNTSIDCSHVSGSCVASLMCSCTIAATSATQKCKLPTKKRAAIHINPKNAQAWTSSMTNTFNIQVYPGVSRWGVSKSSVTTSYGQRCSMVQCFGCSDGVILSKESRSCCHCLSNRVFASNGLATENGVYPQL